MSHPLLTPRQVPRPRSALVLNVGAPDQFVDGLTIAAAAARSELPREVPTPGHEAWLEQRQRDDDELFAKYNDGEDEESSTSEEDSDDKGEDPDVGKNGAPQKRKAAGGVAPRMRGVARQTRKVPEGGSRGPYPCEMEPDERAEYKQAKADKKAKKKAEGADELDAAVKAFEASPLAEKANYVAIVGEVKNWAKRGGTVLTAAKWIRCLVSEGDDRLTPSRVRLNYTRTPPGAA